MKPAYKYILLDLDGTLTDSKRGILKAFQHALRAHGVPDAPDELIAGFIGAPLSEMFSGHFGFNAAQTNSAIRSMRSHYENECLYDFELYPNTEIFLRMLKEQNCFVALATSKPKKFAELMLKRHNLEQYFDLIHGSDTERDVKEKFEIVEEIFQMAPYINKATCMMVGDSKYDTAAAEIHGITGVYVTFGFGHPFEALKHHPHLIVDGLLELGLFIKRSGGFA